MIDAKKCEVTRENSAGKQAICEWTDTSIEKHDLYNFEAKLEYDFHENSPYNDLSPKHYKLRKKRIRKNDFMLIVMPIFGLKRQKWHCRGS